MVNRIKICNWLLIIISCYSTAAIAQRPIISSKISSIDQYLNLKGQNWDRSKIRKAFTGAKSNQTVQGNGVSYSLTTDAITTNTIPTTISSKNNVIYGGGSIICQEKMKSYNEIFHVIGNANPDDYHMIYPGAVYTDMSVIARPFSQKGFSSMERLPMSVFIDLYDPTSPTNTKKIIGTPINNPTAGNIELKIQELLSNNLGASRPALAMPTVFEIKSGAEFNANYKSSLSADILKLLNLIAPGIEIPAALADLKLAASASLSAEASAASNLHFYYAEMKEIFYTVRLDSYPWELIKANTLPGNAVVCDHVKYGRKWIFLIVSTESRSSIQAALESGLNAAGLVQGGQNVSGNISAITKASFARGIFLGGDANDANAVSFENDFNKFKEFVKRTPWTPRTKGFPVDYSFQYLDATPLNIAVKTTNPFLDQTCTKATAVVNIKVNHLKPTFVVDAPGLPPDEELFGDIKVEATYTDNNGIKRSLSSTSSHNELWGVPQSEAKKRTVNQQLNGTTSLYYKFFPEFINQSKLKIIFNIRDKIEDGIESTGQSESAKRYGVKYNFETLEIGIKDISTEGKTFIIKGKDGLAEVAVSITIKAE